MPTHKATIKHQPPYVYCFLKDDGQPLLFSSEALAFAAIQAEEQTWLKHIALSAEVVKRALVVSNWKLDRWRQHQKFYTFHREPGKGYSKQLLYRCIVKTS